MKNLTQAQYENVVESVELLRAAVGGGNTILASEAARVLGESSANNHIVNCFVNDYDMKSEISISDDFIEMIDSNIHTGALSGLEPENLAKHGPVEPEQESAVEVSSPEAASTDAGIENSAEATAGIEVGGSDSIPQDTTFGHDSGDPGYEEAPEYMTQSGSYEDMLDPGFSQVPIDQYEQSGNEADRTAENESPRGAEAAAEEGQEQEPPAQTQSADAELLAELEKVASIKMRDDPNTRTFMRDLIEQYIGEGRKTISIEALNDMSENAVLDPHSGLKRLLEYYADNADKFSNTEIPVKDVVNYEKTWNRDCWPWYEKKAADELAKKAEKEGTGNNKADTKPEAGDQAKTNNDANSDQDKSQNAENITNNQSGSNFNDMFGIGKLADATASVIKGAGAGALGLAAAAVQGRGSDNANVNGEQTQPRTSSDSALANASGANTVNEKASTSVFDKLVDLRKESQARVAASQVEQLASLRNFTKGIDKVETCMKQYQHAKATGGDSDAYLLKARTAITSSENHLLNLNKKTMNNLSKPAVKSLETAGSRLDALKSNVGKELGKTKSPHAEKFMESLEKLSEQISKVLNAIKNAFTRSGPGSSSPGT